MNYYIYLIVNKINNKQYIGQTVNFKKRIKEHSYGRNGNKNSLIDRAIKKYGKNNFDFLIIDVAYNSEDADTLERKYIEQYKTLKPNGYNILLGGRNQQGSWNQKSILVYDLNGNFMKEYCCSAELERESHGKYASRMIRHACYTQTHKYKDILIKYKDNNCIVKRYQKPTSSRKIQINQYDLNGNFMNTYSSLQEASRLTQTRRTSISGCLSGVYKTANGYIWKRADDKSEIPKNVKYFSRNPIYQLDDNKKVLRVFKSCTEAQDYLHLEKGKYKRIFANLDKDKKVYGYYWERVKRQSCAKTPKG